MTYLASRHVEDLGRLESAHRPDSLVSHLIAKSLAELYDAAEQSGRPVDWTSLRVTTVKNHPSMRDTNMVAFVVSMEFAE